MISDQPPPVHQPTHTPVWDLVMADYRKEVAAGNLVDDVADETDQLVLADMAERDRVGRERYGTPLTTGNGRDHLVDAYQEALDLAVYLRAWLEEHPRSDSDDTTMRSHRYQIRCRYKDHLSTLWNLRRIIEEIAKP